MELARSVRLLGKGGISYIESENYDNIKKQFFMTFSIFCFTVVGLKDKYVKTADEIGKLHKEVKEQSEVGDIFEVTFIDSSSFAISYY